MNAQQVYDGIKGALVYFGLPFSRMDEVEFTMEDGGIVMYFGSRIVRFDVDDNE